MDEIRTQNILDACKAEVDRYEAGEPPPGDFPALPPIPASRYLDPEMFELEKKYLFSRTWLYAAKYQGFPVYSFFSKFTADLIRTRFSVTTIIAPSRIAAPWRSIRA